MALVISHVFSCLRRRFEKVETMAHALAHTAINIAHARECKSDQVRRCGSRAAENGPIAFDLYTGLAAGSAKQ